MSVDVLQDKIRKTKNPSMVELCLSASDLPACFLNEASAADAYGSFCKALLTGLKGIVPAVRVSFMSFAILGAEGLNTLQAVLKTAKELGYYVVLDAPEILSAKAAAMTADTVWGENSIYPCDGL